ITMRGCEENEAFLASAWKAIVEGWRAESVVSVFTRFHPILANHRSIMHCGSGGDGFDWIDNPCSQGKTVAIDLSRSQAEIFSSYKRQLRQGLRRILDLGITTTHDPEWRCLDIFVR